MKFLAPLAVAAFAAVSLGGAAGDRYPDGTEIIPQITLRIALDLYAGIRPARRLDGVASPLAGRPAIALSLSARSTI